MKKLIVSTAAIALISAGAVALPLMYAANVSVPAGGTIICVVSANGAVQVANADGGTSDEITATANGNVTLESVSTVTQAEADAAGVPISTDFRLADLTLEGQTEQYGGFHFNFDPDRDTPLSHVTANQVGESFPASGDIYANVKGTVDGLSGTYINSTPCHMSSTNLQTFNPQENEVYTFVDDVTFTNVDASLDSRTFTIRAGGRVTIN